MGCYAEHLGDCYGGISKEHYVSQSVLEIVGRTVQISGFPWQKPDQQMQVGIGALTSKILCSHHNSILSPLDDTGRELVHALKFSFDEALRNENFGDEVFPINGEKLELWLLKILCGILAVFGTVEIPKRWVDILFQKALIPEGSGLHVFGELGSASWFFQLVRVIPVLNKKGGIAGAKFGIGGLAFLLAFGRPQFAEKAIQSLHRPQSIVIEKNGHTKRVDFSWPKGRGVGSIYLEIGMQIEQRNTQFRPVVMPHRKQRE